MGISFLSILLVSLAFIGHDLYTFQTNITADLQSVTDIVADHTAAAVSFGIGFEGDAESTLSNLAVSKYIISADIILRDGTHFASYANSLLIDEPALADDSLFHRTIQSTIEYDEEIYGRLIVEANLRPFVLKRVRIQIAAALAIALISMAISFCNAHLKVDGCSELY